jgi:hypothetical protein
MALISQKWDIQGTRRSPGQFTARSSAGLCEHRFGPALDVALLRGLLCGLSSLLPEAVMFWAEPAC